MRHQRCARKRLRKTGNLPVPLHLRNAPTKLMKELGYGKSYKYAHSFEGNFVDQQYLPDQLKTVKFWQPGKNQQEATMLDRLKKWWGKRYE
jgi:putative ATPase